MYKIGQVIKFYAKDIEWLSDSAPEPYSEEHIKYSNILGITDKSALVYIEGGCYGFISLDKVIKESKKIKVWTPHKNRPAFKFRKVDLYDWEYKFDNFEVSIHCHDNEYICRLFDFERNIIITSSYQKSKLRALEEMIFVARQGTNFLVHLDGL